MRARREGIPGITFRSLLEARWSTVFDELGLAWEYEPVKFDLPSGVYVPDFRITTPDGATFWTEVKGPWPNARELQVASEINLYYLPLMILSGDVPRQPNGGTAWWMDLSTHTWSMLRPEEALIRLMWPEGEQPEHLDGWGDALEAGRHADLTKVEGS